MWKELNNGNKIPCIGLGTYKITPSQLENSIPEAIKSGYRLFDTATSYRNEETIGECLRKIFKEKDSTLKRDEIFITSKLAPSDQGYENALKAVDLSLRKIDLQYIDLYLIHWPGTAKLDPSDPLNLINRKESWRALEECVRNGKIKSIGVSNYTLKHLKEMEGYASIQPAVHQFELHPAYIQTDIIDYCERKGIFVQSYASLGEGALINDEFLQRNPEFIKLSVKYNCTVAQLLLKWSLQRGWGIIPKSINPVRIRENINLEHFKIDKSDMELLNTFHEKESFKKCWNPQYVT